MKLQISYGTFFNDAARIVNKDYKDKLFKFISKTSGIYVITNIKTGEKYIGQSKNIYQRINNHKSLLRNHRHIYKNGQPSLLQKEWDKYGDQNFVFDILQFCKVSELNNYEKYWINFYKTNRLKSGCGYNLNDGGAGQKRDVKPKKKCITINNGEIQKVIPIENLEYYLNLGFNKGLLQKNIEKMNKNRIILQGENHPMYGKKWDKEMRINHMEGIKVAQKEGKYKWKRKPRTKESIEKQKKTFKEKPMNENSLRALNELHKKNRTPVVQLSLSNEYIETFESMRLASKVTGISTSEIWKCCNNKKDSVKDYRWIYEKEYKALH